MNRLREESNCLSSLFILFCASYLYNIILNKWYRSFDPNNEQQKITLLRALGYQYVLLLKSISIYWNIITNNVFILIILGFCRIL